MRRWQSTKIVEAEQITGFVMVGEDIQLKLTGGSDADVSYDWVDKHSNGNGIDTLIGGWYVLYPDGYESWHPEGYELDHSLRADLKPPKLLEDMHPSVQHLLQFFVWHHLPPHLAEVSAPYQEFALAIANRPNNAETTVALRKLLESKDAAVRAEVARLS